MHRERFLKLIDTEFGRIRELNVSKGRDYAGGDDDALANFKDAAKQLGVTSAQVWAVYAHKHWSAIMTYCKEGKVDSEGIEGRIRDLTLYTLLLQGLVEEAGQEREASLRDEKRDRSVQAPRGPDPTNRPNDPLFPRGGLG